MDDFSRTVVVGSSGAGKSTLAGAMAKGLGCAHVELDALQWGAGWKASKEEGLKRKVDEATTGEKWVVDGNYAMVREVIWERATAVVWLDYSFGRVGWQLLKRTVRRGVTGERIFNGNQESLFANFCTRESVLWWMMKTHGSYRVEYAKRFEDAKWAGLTRVRHGRPAETRRFLAEIGR